MGLTQKPDSEPIFLLPPEFWPFLERHYRGLVVLGKGPHHLGSVARVGHGTVIHKDCTPNVLHRRKQLQRLLVPGKPDIGPRSIGGEYHAELLGESRRVQDSRSALVAETLSQTSRC